MHLIFMPCSPANTTLFTGSDLTFGVRFEGVLLGIIWPISIPGLNVPSRDPEGAYCSQAARSTRVSISLRSALKSIGLVNSASAPFSNALRLVSASP